MDGRGDRVAGPVRVEGDEEFPLLLPAASVFLRHGLAQETSEDWGVHAGLQVAPVVLLAAGDPDIDLPELLASFSELDLYVQTPGEAPRGAGLIASRYHLMPYVQYGREDAEGEGWYGTLGLARYQDENDRMLIAMPAAARREAGFGGRSVVHFQLTGGLGYRERRHDFRVPGAGRKTVWMLVGSIVLEFGRARRPE